MFERTKTKTIVDECCKDSSYEYNEVDNYDTDCQICIRTRDDEFYVDDCKENWDILKDLNDKTEGFIYLKDSSERDDGILGIRVSEIMVFYPEKE